MDAVGGRRIPSATSNWSLLSDRERQIAGCVALGYSNKGIAGTLEITEKTVEKHLTKIFHKVGVHSRAQLLLFIVSEGTK
ncbi:MAG: helix-turn-helix transcriptional regulator [Candidatus Eremiobacteraeota bacterium]|nr:helix-turn-helix transcriptional regulator [Candidatus Eremiobacteraeota bacterium]MBC5802514.1 helix-turn-helix transcriptional regulator [Candidatus Eremiobacteraeota bacterium]MBC5820533.1 helix-turn-helix transcriptional regulator [Candidatus Eremiobacteraeota bacterium]